MHINKLQEPHSYDHRLELGYVNLWFRHSLKSCYSILANKTGLKLFFSV